MAVCEDPWMQEYNEVAQLGTDIAGMMSERRPLHASGPDAQSYLFALKRKILVYGTRLDTLEFHLSRQQQHLSVEEMSDRKVMVADFRSKMYEMPSSTLNVSTSANRSSLLEPANAITIASTEGLDNSQILQLQRQTIQAQDEELEKLMETIGSTYHVAWAINQEFHLHERLTVDANKYVEVPDSRIQGVGRRFATVNSGSTRCGSSCIWLSVTAIAVLAALIYVLIKYL